MSSSAFSSRALPKTPKSEREFDAEWVSAVMRDFFVSEGLDPDQVCVNIVKARKNDVQGILSTTYIVDFEYSIKGGETKAKSIFVKVPLKDEPQFENVNVREMVMLKEVLPKLETFLDEMCKGFFRLPMPKVQHCYYDGKGDYDCFVLDNLLDEDYYNFSNEKCLNEDHMKAVLDCLSYLHGTGLAYKHSTGGREVLLREFPRLEVQLQLSDLIEEDSSVREHFRRHFRAFLHYLEEAEPALGRHTAYMKKMHKEILKGVIATLENCGYERLITLAHGDAKPNNFMFRLIQIDLEELECEGIEPILVDWQGGFLGSVANDLMWAIFPFVEQDTKLFPQVLKYYFEQLGNVLESFELTYADLELPADFGDFSSLLKKCLVLEFLIVTIIKPVMSIPKPEKLLRWHKETLKNQKRRFKKKVDKPEMLEVFTSPRFTGFCHLYFRIATSLGAFQELGSIRFQVMKDLMFIDPNAKMDTYDSDEEIDHDLFSRVINAPAKTLVMGGLCFCFALSGMALSLAVGWHFHKQKGSM